MSRIKCYINTHNNFLANSFIVVVMREKVCSHIRNTRIYYLSSSNNIKCEQSHIIYGWNINFRCRVFVCFAFQFIIIFFFCIRFLFYFLLFGVVVVLHLLLIYTEHTSEFSEFSCKYFWFVWHGAVPQFIFPYLFTIMAFVLVLCTAQPISYWSEFFPPGFQFNLEIFHICAFHRCFPLTLALAVCHAIIIADAVAVSRWDNPILNEAY